MIQCVMPTLQVAGMMVGLIDQWADSSRGWEHLGQGITIWLVRFYFDLFAFSKRRFCDAITLPVCLEWCNSSCTRA